MCIGYLCELCTFEQQGHFRAPVISSIEIKERQHGYIDQGASIGRYGNSLNLPYEFRDLPLGHRHSQIIWHRVLNGTI